MTDDPLLDSKEIWRVTIAAPIETVWSVIVATDEVMPQLFGAVCDAPDGLDAGSAFCMRSRNGQVTTVVGQVLDFSPPYRFSHTIHFTQNTGEVPGRTTYELKEVPGGTELTLIAEAVAGSKTAKMGRTGPFIVANIKALAETGRPTVLGRLITAMAPLTVRFLPKTARSELWPVGRTRE